MAVSKEFRLRKPPFRPRIYIWDCDKRERDDTDFSLPNPMNLRIGTMGMRSMGLNNAQESGSCESMDMSLIPFKPHPLNTPLVFSCATKKGRQCYTTTPSTSECSMLLLA